MTNRAEELGYSGDERPSIEEARRLLSITLEAGLPGPIATALEVSDLALGLDSNDDLYPYYSPNEMDDFYDLRDEARKIVAAE